MRKLSYVSNQFRFLISNVKQTLLISGLLFISSASVHANDWVYTVQAGDNLWNIADYYLKRGIAYSDRLQALNQIKDPRHLSPGTTIKIPLSWLKRQSVPAVVHSIQGQCEAFSDHKPPYQLTVTMLLRHGDSVRCQADSSMMLRFVDNSRLLVQQQTEFTLDTVSNYARTKMVDTRIRLKSGHVDTQVQHKQGPGSRFQISTPSAVAAVRGTDFRIMAGSEQMRAEVLKGQVEMQAKRGKRLVNSGYGLQIKQGKVPPKPKKLLPPPDISNLPDTLHYLPLHFSWPVMPKVIQYRFQVAPDKHFETLLLDKTTSKAEISFSGLDDGDYVLRLRAIDAEGLEGLNAIHAFHINARPEAPMAVNPVNDANIYKPQPKFWWSKPEQTVAYHFQLAKDAEFKELVIDQADYDESQLLPNPGLEPGTYYWRIASYDDSGEQGPYSLPLTVNIKEKPLAPEAEEPGMNAEQIYFQWKADPEADYYQFQLSDDDDFEELLLDIKADQSKYSIALTDLEPDDYYFRIQTINKDGVAGEFSRTQELEIPSETSPYWSVLLLLILIPILL